VPRAEAASQRRLKQKIPCPDRHPDTGNGKQQERDGCERFYAPVTVPFSLSKKSFGTFLALLCSE
ncbi:MAG: hypothetical protein IKI69_06280, partial [Oscillospiraceae bacterium]|nr:hypothetical protein [Oscillospiraceae bacterium]